MAVTQPERVAHDYAFENGVLHRIACFELPDMPARVRTAYESLSFLREPEQRLKRYLGDDATPDADTAPKESRLRLAWLVSLMTKDNAIAQDWFQDCPVLAKGFVVGVSHFDLHCLEEAIRLLWTFERTIAAPAPNAPDANGLFDTLHKRYQGLVCITTAARILIEARRRNIPAKRLSVFMDVYQFGYGTQRRRFQASKSGETPRISGLLTTYKPMATDILRQNGLPTPDNAIVPTLDAALKWVANKGTPVVVKPTSQDMGTGVTINITTPDELRTAFESAKKYGRVMVEQQIPGEETRIVVIGGQVLAAYKVVCAFVVGDGQKTIGQLAREKHAARQRNPDTTGKAFVDPTSAEAGELLTRQGCTAETVPEKGRTVRLSDVANAGRGGERVLLDLSDFHPDNLRMAQRAAALFDIDFAGVDYITEDISASFLTGKGAINEVNISPALPFADLGNIFFDHSYKDGRNGAISISVIVGDLSEPDGEAIRHAFFDTEPLSGKIAVLNNQVFSEQGPDPRTGQNQPGLWESALADGRAQSALLHITPDQLNALGFPVCYFDRLFFLAEPPATTPAIANNASIMAVAKACGGECGVASLDEILLQLGREPRD